MKDPNNLPNTNYGAEHFHAEHGIPATFEEWQAEQKQNVVKAA